MLVYSKGYVDFMNDEHGRIVRQRNQSGNEKTDADQKASDSRWSRLRFTRPSHSLFLALEMRKESNDIDGYLFY